MIYEYIINNYGTEHTYAIFYVLNLIFGILAFKLGFARKLPVIKSILVYIMLAIGTYIITIFSILPTAMTQKPLPMTESLIVIALVMGLYRIRLHQQRKSK
ncbi:YlaH-like family protein [Virgibacillus byunsanensis]|uniref:YlaH-like family protein n=1 Tax=Virgibacillus byunsanensis TaxID=570945 RepID=A0ABW3LK09_9BACI